MAAKATDTKVLVSVSGKSVCIEVCKYEHKTKRGGRQLEMIQCSVCAGWFHTECVGIKKDAPIGVWPCTSCRLIPEQIKSIVNTIGSLTKTMNTLTSSNTKLSAQFEGKEAECTELRKDNANLRIADSQISKTNLGVLHPKTDIANWRLAHQRLNAANP